MNVDAGIFPPALLVIQNELNITEKEIAILNSVTFLVCGTLSIMMAPLMLKFEARSVLVSLAICNSVGSMIFLLTKHYWILVLARAMSGAA